jgi:shikimate kinase
MPGAGKSTVGVLLAKRLSRWFIDTDVLIQSIEMRALKDIIAEHTLEGFLAIERAHLESIEAANAVIATGGSAVYSPCAMEKLKSGSLCVYLDVPLEEIERRIGNITERGVVISEGKTIKRLYAERAPLYERYADITVPCASRSLEENVDAVIEAITASV